MSEILNIDEVCAYLKMTRSTIYRQARSGKIPAVKMGKGWKFHKNSLDQWVRQCIEEDTANRRKTSSLKPSPYPQEK